MRLDWSENDVALSWAADRIPYMHGEPFPDNARAVSFYREDGKRAGVVAFHDWQPNYKTMQVSAIAEDAGWLKARKCWAKAFDYVFVTCGVNKVWSMTPHTDDRAIRFVRALGFLPEAILQDQFGPGLHGVLSAKWARDHYPQ